MSSEKRGMLFIVIGMAVFCIQDIVIKSLENQVSLTQILFFRAALGTILLTGLLWFLRKPIKFGSSYPLIAIFRGSSFFLGFTMFYISISKLPLAIATSLFFIHPIIVTIISIFFLKISIGFHRITAIIIGFIGTLLIIKPSIYNFDWYMLFPIATAFSYSIGMLLAKKTSDRDNAFQQSFHIYFGGLILSPFITILVTNAFPNMEINQLQFLYIPWEITEFDTLVALVIIAFTGTIGIFSLVYAYNIGSPQSNAPIEYMLLVYALLAGYIIFEEIPDLLSFLGMVMISLSGIYIFIRESVREEIVAAEKQW
tara:strand:+ start:81 stop:1016 length:936 start_codon:yes stop_codon:yes gene_type:complete